MPMDPEKLCPFPSPKSLYITQRNVSSSRGEGRLPDPVNFLKPLAIGHFHHWQPWHLSPWAPRPTQSSGNAPSSPVEDDEQGCTQAGVGEGFSKVSVGNPSQKCRRRCMFRHKSSKTASGSGYEMGLLLAAWRRRGGTWR